MINIFHGEAILDNLMFKRLLRQGIRFPTYKIILLIFFIAFLSGCFWSSKTLGQPLIPGGDEELYDRVALNILKDGDFSRNVGGVITEPQPLYPLFLAGIFSVFGHNWDAVRVIQIILFASIAVIIFLLAKDLFNRKIAIYSGLLAALFYPLAAYSVRLYREVFFASLLAFLIYCLYKAQLSGKKKWFVFSGIVLGSVMLTNAVLYFFPLLVVGNFLIIYRKKFFTKKVLFSVFLFIFSLGIVLAPWLARDYYSERASVGVQGGGTLLARAYLIEAFQGEYGEHFIGQSLGYFFAKKLNPQLDSKKLYGLQTRTVVQKFKELSSAGYNEKEISKILQEEALTKIFKQPHLYLFVSFLDFLSFNNPLMPDPKDFQSSEIQELFVGTHPEFSDFTKASIILAIRSIWLIFFFFIGYAIIKNLKNWPKFSWIFLIIFYFNLVYALLSGLGRYALPIYPFYILLFIWGFTALSPQKYLKKYLKFS